MKKTLILIITLSYYQVCFSQRTVDTTYLSFQFGNREIKFLKESGRNEIPNPGCTLNPTHLYSWETGSKQITDFKIITIKGNYLPIIDESFPGFAFDSILCDGVTALQKKSSASKGKLYEEVNVYYPKEDYGFLLDTFSITEIVKFDSLFNNLKMIVNDREENIEKLIIEIVDTDGNVSNYNLEGLPNALTERFKNIKPNSFIIAKFNSEINLVWCFKN